MDKLFPNGKHLWQTQNTRWLVAQSPTLLHMARLEESRTEKKKPYSLGVDQDHAYAWSRTRMGGWRVAQSPILVTTITLKRLQKKGYESMLDYFLKVFPQFNEPLYTRPRSLS